MTRQFVHLHNHTEYSLLDGSAKIVEMVQRAKDLGMDSIAITDHGSLFGAIHFYKAAKAVGIKPIMGCEVYVASGSRHDKENKPSNFAYHLVLLAENNEGWRNLMKLVSMGHTEGFYYRPRIDLELLREHNEGLICLSACLAGPVAKNILNVSYERGKQEAVTYKEIFGKDRFFLEIQGNGMQEQNLVNDSLIRMSKELDLDLVATNDCHYLYADDAKAHEVLVCIQTGKTMLDDNRLEFNSNEFYLKSPEQMWDTFEYASSALENTVKIAERCNVEINFHEYKLPKYDTPNNRDAAEFLKEITMAGLVRRYGQVEQKHIERAEFELGTINSMGFNDYFLVTWDFINYAHNKNIAVGPGRGTSAGSIVAYALGITNIDPLLYDLNFERFLNPERISMPDIDIDFCYERRQEVIDYVVEKYGKDRVAQIITFGTMGAKAVVRDVGRGLGMQYAEVDVIAKMIPFALGMTIERALEMSPELAREYRENEKATELIDMARRLEGLPRHASTHAAGVVISDAPLVTHVPLNTNDGVITTQFDMNTLEELGLLKMDFLGLRTLTVIRHTVDEVARRHGVQIDLDKIDMEDTKVFEAISAGRTEGMFQLESRGMTSLMKELKPASVTDLMAGIALFRPGPMEFIPKYVRSKHNAAAVTYTHPLLEPILRETYGCIVYQEQVMQIVRDLGGYSWGRSDLVRRAMSKKKKDVMEQEKAYFIHGIEGEVPGAVANGIPEAVAEKIFKEMEDFAEYAFGKAHSAAYATIGYQTAWLKIHYPAEFMAALMTSVMDRADKIAEYIGECKKMGLELLPPDVNESLARFTVVDYEGKPAIRFGMNAIKNLGRPTVSIIVAERENSGKYKTLTEFINRLQSVEATKSADLNKRGLEALIKAGAFSSFGGTRSQYMAVYERFLSGSQNSRKSNMAGQISLLDMSFDDDEGAGEVFQDELPKIEEFPIKKLLEDEKEVLGIYVSGHPLMDYEDYLKRHISATSADFVYNEDEEITGQSGNLEDDQKVIVGGIVSKKNIVYTRRDNKPMCFITIEDLKGFLEVVVFPNLYHIHGSKLVEGAAVLVEGKVNIKEEQASVVVCETLRFLEKDGDVSETLWLKIEKDKHISMEDIIAILSRYGGLAPVMIYDEASGERKKVAERYWINSKNEDLLHSLKGLLGDGCVVLK
ncbi:MAG: DNA polymerase III subunit alpha [Defluviitaleaceae bacterium]|nr:DNA polymerase III subunit alpha [Defluviitaleaceae bacterium]